MYAFDNLVIRRKTCTFELFASLANVDKCVYKLPLIFFLCLVVSQKVSDNAVSKTVLLMKYMYGSVIDIQVITFWNMN